MTTSKQKTSIIAGLIATGVIAGGVVMLNNPETESQTLTVQEWRVVVALYDEELKQNNTFTDVKDMDSVLEKLDERILIKAQSKPQDEKNVIEGILVKRSEKNNGVIRNLR